MKYPVESSINNSSIGDSTKVNGGQRGSEEPLFGDGDMDGKQRQRYMKNCKINGIVPLIRTSGDVVTGFQRMG